MNEKPSTDVKQQAQAVKKINILLGKGIEWFKEFLRLCEDKAAKAMSATLTDDIVRPVLVAYFSIGRLYSKLISADPRQQLQNWKECEEWYRKFEDYINRNPEQQEHVAEEIPLLQEMLQLIPGKIKMILQSTVY